MGPSAADVPGDEKGAESLGTPLSPQREDRGAPAPPGVPVRRAGVAPGLAVEVGHPPGKGRTGRDGDEGLGRGGGRAESRVEAEAEAADGETRRQEEAERFRFRGTQELEMARAARGAVLPDRGEEGAAGAAAARSGRHLQVEDDEDVPPDRPGREAEKRAGLVGRREEAVRIGREGMAQLRRAAGKVLFLRGPDRDGFSGSRHHPERNTPPRKSKRGSDVSTKSNLASVSDG